MATRINNIPDRRSLLRHGLAAVAMTAVAVFAGWPAWRDIWNIGSNDEESSHILLVPIVVAWILWVRRGRFRRAEVGGRWPGASIVAAGWLLMSFGYRHQVQTFWHGGAVMMAAGCVATVFGSQYLRAGLPAALALVFLIPVASTGRQLIAVPLQTITAHATQVMCETVGITVERSGNLLTINGNNVAVAEACNGMRMVFALIMVCYTFAFISPLRTYVRMLVLAMSPVVAIACNVIRLVPTVYVYGNYSERVAEKFHDASGWVMLVLGYLMLTGVVQLLRWAMVPVDEGVAVPMARSTAVPTAVMGGRA